MDKAVVLGGGITGVTFANIYKNAIVYEKEDVLGGKCRTFTEESPVGTFKFDVGGHWFHAKGYEELLNLFTGLQEYERKAYVDVFGNIVKFPIQEFYTDLPDDALVSKIREELNSTTEEKIRESKNYSEMLENMYGSTLYKLFFEGYNKKLFGVKQLGRLNYGNVELVRNVKVGDKKGYNNNFKYPIGGKGIQELIRQLSDGVDYHTGYEVTKIDLRSKVVHFKNGEKVNYDLLVSTLPLQDFVKMCTYINKDIKKKGRSLKSSMGLIYNLGVKAKSIHAGKTWVYYGDKDLPFYRVGIYSNVDKGLSPDGYHSMYVECDTTNKDNLPTIEDVVKGLIEVGMLDTADDLICSHKVELDHNYCFVDDNIQDIKDYLEGKGVYSIGRYGSWYWGSMHEDMLQAIRLADELNK